jgi:Xaa-Pro aminopeptidase
MYNADLSRTVPVNGRFTERQRAVYDAVLRVQRRATALLRPGTLLHEYHEEVGRVMEGELIGLGLLDAAKVKAQDPKAPLYKKYFMHGTSHHLGLDVHDIGDRYGAIREGNVFTVEPGIYLPEEGFGIRLENDVVVTDGDPVDLMADIPVEAEAIEELMNAR